MALLDHFRPPLSIRRHWHSFHNAWSTYLSDSLNQSLPEGYFAEPNAQFGIEIDVAASSERIPVNPSHPNGELPEWIPQAPTATLPFQPITDVVEVQIFNVQAGPTLVGAIELINPANKDRPTHRDAFTSKCQTYLQQGIGLMMVDVVTNLSANLHNELMKRLDSQIEPMDAELYAVAYRIAETNGTPHLDFWQEAFTVGSKLPILPLFLKGGLYLPVDLDETYHYICVRQRIPEYP
ncbi:MAG: DUF4058 family protein [Nostoc sp.]|uniref:DUF4058 family protein n=1 Tax=Nostoc sp. TaxID=1180 RepID=UPI002FF0F931